MKSFVCLLLASVLVALSASHAEAAMSAGVLTAARLKLEKILGRQIIPTLSPNQVTQLQSLFERKLRLLRLKNAILAQADCLVGKAEAVRAATTALANARDCTYNGLTFAQFAELRDLCEDRDGLTGAALTQAQQACVDIGRSPPNYAPPSCPSVSALKADLASATEALLACGTGGLTLATVENQLRTIDTQINNVLAGQPTPSNDPRFPSLEAF